MSEKDPALQEFLDTHGHGQSKIIPLPGNKTFKDLYEATRWAITSLNMGIEKTEEGENNAAIFTEGKVLSEKKKFKARIDLQQFEDTFAVKIRHDMKTKKPDDIGSRALDIFWNEINEKLGLTQEGDVETQGDSEASPTGGISTQDQETSRVSPSVGESLDPEKMAIIDSIIERFGIDPKLAAMRGKVQDVELISPIVDAFFTHAREQDKWPATPLRYFQFTGVGLKFPAMFLAVEEIDIGSATLKPLQFSFLVPLPYPVSLEFNISDKFYFSLLQKVAEEFQILNYLNSELPLLRKYLAEAYYEPFFSHLERVEIIQDRGKKAKIVHDIVRLHLIMIRNITIEGDQDGYIVARFWLGEKLASLPSPGAIMQAFNELLSNLGTYYILPEAPSPLPEVAATPQMPLKTVATPEKCPHCGWLLSAGKTTCPMCQKNVLEGPSTKEYVNEILREVQLVEKSATTRLVEIFDKQFMRLEKMDKKLPDTFPVVTKNQSYFDEFFPEALYFIRASGSWDVQPITQYYFSVIGMKHFKEMYLLVDFVDAGSEEKIPVQLTFIFPTERPLYYNFAAQASGIFVNDLDPRFCGEEFQFLRDRHPETEDIIARFYNDAELHAFQSAQGPIQEKYPIRVVSYETGMDVASAVTAKFFIEPGQKKFPNLLALIHMVDNFLEAVLERTPDPSTLTRCSQCGRILVIPGSVCHACAAVEVEKDEADKALAEELTMLSEQPAEKDIGGELAGEDLGDFLEATESGDLGDFLGGDEGDLDDLLMDAPSSGSDMIVPPGESEASPASVSLPSEPLPETLEEIDQKITELNYQINGVKELMNGIQQAFSAGQITFEDYQGRNDQYLKVIQEMQDKVRQLERAKFSL